MFVAQMSMLIKPVFLYLIERNYLFHKFIREAASESQLVYQNIYEKCSEMETIFRLKGKR